MSYPAPLGCRRWLSPMTPGVICLTDHEVAVTRRYLETRNAKQTAAEFGIGERRVRQLAETCERKTGLSRPALTVMLLGQRRPRKTSVTADGQLVMAL